VRGNVNILSIDTDNHAKPNPTQSLNCPTKSPSFSRDLQWWCLAYF